MSLVPLPAHDLDFSVAMVVLDSDSLNAILHSELSQGNRIMEDGPGWGSMKRLIILELPFRSDVTHLPGELILREVNDPHYWMTEIEDFATNEMLACRFG